MCRRSLPAITSVVMWSHADASARLNRAIAGAHLRWTGCDPPSGQPEADCASPSCGGAARRSCAASRAGATGGLNGATRGKLHSGVLFDPDRASPNSSLRIGDARFLCGRPAVLNPFHATTQSSPPAAAWKDTLGSRRPAFLTAPAGRRTETEVLSRDRPCGSLPPIRGIRRQFPAVCGDARRQRAHRTMWLSVHRHAAI